MNLHIREKIYTCGVCKKEFWQKQSLASHMDLHNKDGFKCCVCSNIFTRRCNLQEHMNHHTREKVYTCGICKKRVLENGDFALPYGSAQ